MAPDALIINTSTAIGGTARVVQLLARGLGELGWTAECLFPPGDAGPELLAWLARDGVEARLDRRALQMEAPHTLRDTRALAGLVRSSGCRAVSLHFGLCYLSLKDVLAVRLGGARCVASAHHVVPWSSLNLGKQRITRLASLLCHRVVAGTPAMQALLLEARVAKRKLAVAPYGVAPATVRPERAQARRRFCLPADAFLVSALGRLVPHKGFADLIKALADVELADTVLLIAGEGPEREALECLAARLLPGRAVFAGRVDSVEEVYAAADVFALPSYEEGFGLVYLEAALQGVPSVACAVGGVPAAVEDEVTGILINPGDVAALSAALRRLRKNESLRRRLGEAAQARATGEATHLAMAQCYAQALFPGEPGRPLAQQ